MSVFTYNATRNLVPGRVPDEQVQLELRLNTMPKRINAKTRRNEAISGAVESILYREVIGFVTTSELIDPESLTAQTFEEFFSSCYNAEEFTFDRFGTIAVPDNPVTCILESTTLTEIEVGKIFLRYTVNFREV